MSQKVIFIRGSACSGKTTICKEIRNYEEKLAWISIDKLKEIFSHFEDKTLDEVHKSANTVLADLLNRGFNVVVDGIFKKQIYYEGLTQILKRSRVSIYYVINS